MLVCWGHAPGQSRKSQEANKRSTPRIVNAFKHQLEARMPKGVMERYAAIFEKRCHVYFLTSVEVATCPKHDICGLARVLCVSCLVRKLPGANATLCRLEWLTLICAGVTAPSTLSPAVHR